MKPNYYSVSHYTIKLTIFTTRLINKGIFTWKNIAMHSIINKKLIRIYIYGILSQIHREFAQGEPYVFKQGATKRTKRVL